MFFSIKSWRDGDEEAYARVFKRYRKPLLRYVQTLVACEETAQELTQEAFLKAFRFRESYQDQNALSTWLWTIAKNTVMDHFRSTKAGSSHRQDTAGFPEDLPCPEHRADLILEKKDDRRTLLRLTKSLTRLQKRVLWMRAVHHLSNQEIAAKLGLSLSAVKNLAHRAKRSLTQSLDFVTFAEQGLALAF